MDPNLPAQAGACANLKTVSTVLPEGSVEQEVFADDQSPYTTQQLGCDIQETAFEVLQTVLHVLESLFQLEGQSSKLSLGSPVAIRLGNGSEAPPVPQGTHQDSLGRQLPDIQPDWSFWHSTDDV